MTQTSELQPKNNFFSYLMILSLLCSGIAIVIFATQLWFVILPGLVMIGIAAFAYFTIQDEKRKNRLAESSSSEKNKYDDTQMTKIYSSLDVMLQVKVNEVKQNLQTALGKASVNSVTVMEQNELENIKNVQLPEALLAYSTSDSKGKDIDLQETLDLMNDMVVNLVEQVDLKTSKPVTNF